MTFVPNKSKSKNHPKEVSNANLVQDGAKICDSLKNPHLFLRSWLAKSYAIQKKRRSSKANYFLQKWIIDYTFQCKKKFCRVFFPHFDAKKIKVGKFIAKYFVLFDDFSKWSACTEVKKKMKKGLKYFQKYSIICVELVFSK